MKEASRRNREPDYVSSAWDELVSKTPELQGFEREIEAHHDLKEKIGGTLGSQSEIRAGIEKLHKEGADTHVVLDALALEVVIQKCRSRLDYWLPQMRQKKRSHKSLAARIRKTALEIEKTYCDLGSHPDLWEVILLKVCDGPVTSAAEKVPRELLSLMQKCATELEMMAGDLGRLCKSESPYYNRVSVVRLMDYLHRATGDINPHFMILAEILMATYQTFGIKVEPPTKESLKKTFTRHVLPRHKR